MGHLSLVQLLVERKADIHAVSEKVWTTRISISSSQTGQLKVAIITFNFFYAFRIITPCHLLHLKDILKYAPSLLILVSLLATCLLQTLYVCYHNMKLLLLKNSVCGRSLSSIVYLIINYWYFWIELGMWFCRSDWAGLYVSTLVCCQPTEWILCFFLFHKFSNFTPPPRRLGLWLQPVPMDTSKFSATSLNRVLMWTYQLEM